MTIAYPVLAGEIAKRGIKKVSIASGAGMTDRCLRNKLTGLTPFSLPEALAIKNRFFPDMDFEYLFSKADNNLTSNPLS